MSNDKNKELAPLIIASVLALLLVLGIWYFIDKTVTGPNTEEPTPGLTPTGEVNNITPTPTPVPPNQVYEQNRELDLSGGIKIIPREEKEVKEEVTVEDLASGDAAIVYDDVSSSTEKQTGTFYKSSTNINVAYNDSGIITCFGVDGSLITIQAISEDTFATEQIEKYINYMGFKRYMTDRVGIPIEKDEEYELPESAISDNSTLLVDDEIQTAIGDGYLVIIETDYGEPKYTGMVYIESEGLMKISIVTTKYENVYPLLVELTNDVIQFVR